MFEVIEFLDDTAIEVVPVNWCTEEENNRVCRWPPYRPQLIGKAVKAMETPKPDWAVYPIRRIGGPYASYEKAREKCRRAEDTSDIQSSDVGSPKRKRRTPQKYRSDDDEEGSPSRPATRRQLPPSYHPVHSPPPQVPPLPVFLPETMAPLPSSSRIQLPSTSTSTLSSSGPEPPQNIGEDLKFLTKLMLAMGHRIEELNCITKEMNVRLISMEKALRSQQLSVPPIPEEDFNLPMTSMEDVDLMEERLKDTAYAKRVATYLGSIGGKTPKEIARRLMERIFTNELAEQFNWLGRGEKRAFSTLRLRNTMFLAAKANKHVEVKEDEVATSTKDWLRFAKARQGGQRKTAARKEVTDLPEATQ